MDVGVFELTEPIPQLRRPHLFMSLQPWIDVGSVGTGALTMLEAHLGAADLGRLRRPSVFYDFTRYRPRLYRVEGVRHVEFPNTVLRYAKGSEDHDFVFAHAMEPHAHAEDFMESLLQAMDYLGTERYCQVGAMYGSSPHTRPLTVTGSSTEERVQRQLEGLLSVRASTYEGPTSALALMTEELRKRNIQTLAMMVHLPPYAQLDEDPKGQERVLHLLNVLYSFRLDLSDLQRKGTQKYRELDRAVQADPQVRAMVRRLEESYDASAENPQKPGNPPSEQPSLSPEVERFLKGLEHRDDAP